MDIQHGCFFSRDDGKLFKCSAESELDCVKGQDINNRGNGYFVDVNMAKNNLEGGIAVSKFDGFWIEDNFAVHSDRNSVLTQDHGTNPFPTSATIGPDFTNNDETAVALRLKYNWKDYVKGLKPRRSIFMALARTKVTSAVILRVKSVTLTLR